jgi:hypothetical protein
MEAVSTSETSVNFYGIIRRSIPEDSHLSTEAYKSTYLCVFSRTCCTNTGQMFPVRDVGCRIQSLCTKSGERLCANHTFLQQRKVGLALNFLLLELAGFCSYET